MDFRIHKITGACLVLVTFLALPALLSSQEKKAGNPEENLPPNITHVTDFGERAAWSPDGKRIAFMGKSFGDAYEIDLQTKKIRKLTGHFHHAGFLRVQYFPNGDYFLIGARTFTDIHTTRDRDEEMWVLRKDLKDPPAPLDQKISEGVAISRQQMKIAWANTHGQYPDKIAAGESILYTADVTIDGGVPRLANKREILHSDSKACTLEAQDFRDNDSELIYTCYRAPQYADVMGVDLKSGKVTTYRNIPDEYNEVEGIWPNGKWTCVESSREQGPNHQDAGHIDIWRLRLLPSSKDFIRLTHWGEYKGYKASNPVISPDGKWMAFQSARNDEPAGVGHGIFLMKLE